MTTSTEEPLVDDLEGTVREVMTRNVHCVNADTSVAEVADQMTENSLRRVVIVDQRRRVVGVVSQRDILRRFVSSCEQPSKGEKPSKEKSAKKEKREKGPVWDSVAIKELITREKPVTVSPDLPLMKAAVVLGTNKIGCLPVVEKSSELVGVLTITDLLRHVSGGSAETLESTFQFYMPSKESRAKMPAYIRKMSGELVIPLKCMERSETVGEFATLGYDPPTGRVLIKFLKDGNPAEGAVKTRVEDGCLVIAASGFVSHFDLSGRINAFDISVHKNDRYLVLTPRHPQQPAQPLPAETR